MKNIKRNHPQSKMFAGYRVVTKLGTELSSTNKYQIQQIAMLLNAYETFK